MQKIGLDLPKSGRAYNIKEAVEVAEKIGFPIIIRPSFTLGGTGGSVAYNIEEFKELARQDGLMPHVHQALAVIYDRKGLYKEAIEEAKYEFSLNSSARQKMIEFLALLYGKIGQAIYFDGVDDSITTGIALSNFISASTSTVSVWVKPRGTPPTSASVYLLQQIMGEAGAYFGIFRGIYGSDYICGYVWDIASKTACTSYKNDEWAHIVTVHGNGNIYIYKNGMLIQSNSAGDVNATGMSQLVNINRAYASAQYFNGPIDDVRIYNRALSAAEVAQLYNSAKINYMR